MTTRLGYTLTLALALVGLLCGTLSSGPSSHGVAARNTSPQHLKAKRAEAMERWRRSAAQGRSGESNPLHARAHSMVKNITFTNPKASHFYVDGKNIPDVDWDVGTSWAGLMPISPAPNETRKLYFWLFLAGPEGSLDDLIIWLNGGPGCSSLEGLLQENGPFRWPTGVASPEKNEWSWTNLSNILYVEQPVGTGFSQGVPNVKDEVDVAEQFVGFLKQFLEIFSELKGKNLFITGESYAGMFVPYIANRIYEKSDVDLRLRGTWMNDAVIGHDIVHQIAARPFLLDRGPDFALNQTFHAHLAQVARRCNYMDYIEKNVQYPPKGILPLPGNSTEFTPECDIWNEIAEAALLLNAGLNVYHIPGSIPIPSDVLGFPASFPLNDTNPYFNRTEVKAAINAPADVDWNLCNTNVFPKGDASPPPAFGVLPSVIEKNRRTVISHGRADFVLIAEGTRISLQNMTWNGKQGFDKPPRPDSFIVDGIGAMGTVQSERGLTYAEIVLAGHMLPEYSPVASFQLMRYLMGFRDSP